MGRFWGGILCLGALLVIALPVQADEVEDLQRAVQELKAEIAEMKAEQALEASSVEKVVDEYLSRRAAGEGSGDTAGYLDGKFGFRSPEGDFALRIGGGVVFDARFYELDNLQLNTFDIGLVRLNFSGQVGEGMKYKIQPEFSTSGVVLRDAYMAFALGRLFGATGSDYFDGIEFKVGQFKMPFSYSALTSSYHNDLITRPILVRGVAPGRDIGLQFANTLYEGMLYYALAMSNGTNSTNDTNEFSYWARIVVAPFLNNDNWSKHFHFGLSFGTAYNGEGETPALRTAGMGPYSEVGSSDKEGYDQFYPSLVTCGRELLWGLEVIWFFQQWAVKAEWLYQTQDLKKYDDYMTTTSIIDRDIGQGSSATTMGGYVEVAYMVTGEDWVEAPESGWELVGQFEWGQIDAGGDTDKADFMAYTVGANYYLSKNARFMFDVVANDLGSDSYRSGWKDGEVRGGGVDFNFLLRLQLTF